MKENDLNNNIIEDLLIIINNIPKDVDLISKIRWVYIKLGWLFSYNYRVVNDSKYMDDSVDLNSKYISRYQTCIQISQILNSVLNMIPGCKSEIVERKANLRGHYDREHVCNAVYLESGEKIMLDLTLDLYLIQGGFQTKHFGYFGDEENTCDIISLSECRICDEKMGLIKDGEYLDDKLERLKSSFQKMNSYGLPFEELIDYKMIKISELIPHMKGYHEAKMFISKMFIDVLDISYSEYNLSSLQSDNSFKMVTCFNIGENESLWYIYDEEIGLVKTSKEKILAMLEDGWTTKSNTLQSKVLK